MNYDKIYEEAYNNELEKVALMGKVRFLNKMNSPVTGLLSDPLKLFRKRVEAGSVFSDASARAKNLTREFDRLDIARSLSARKPSPIKRPPDLRPSIVSKK